jgi:hypothetical protein
VRRADIHAVGELAGEAIAAGGSLIKEMHLGIASRPSGALALGAINGLWGNHLHDRGHAVAFATEIRRDGAGVPVSAAGLAAAFPDATSRIAVFVHGLCENDESWAHLPLGGDRPRRTYGERMQDELSFTPVWSPAAPVTTRSWTGGGGAARSVTSSAWARRISAPTWRRGCTCSAGRSARRCRSSPTPPTTSSARHPAVYEQIRAWILRRPARRAAGGGRGIATAPPVGGRLRRRRCRR